MRNMWLLKKKKGEEKIFATSQHIYSDIYTVDLIVSRTQLWTLQSPN